MKVYFEEVSIKGKKSGKCECGKRITRQNTFMQTISGFNKNKEGGLKTKAEILKELVIERDEWIKKPVHCSHKSYWGWSKEQREEYNDQGKVEIIMNCGYPLTIFK